MRKRSLYLISALSFFLFFPFSGETQDIHFELVSRPEGEGNSQITSFTQDKQGFLWIGTGYGLFKYDGFKFTAYYSQASNPNSLTSDWIQCVLADKEGYIWIGHGGNSYHSALDRFNPSTGIFTHFRHLESDPFSPSSDTVFTMMQDHEGTIWLGTSTGLDRFDSRTNRFYHYQHKENDPASLSCNSVNSIYEDKEGTLWVGTGSDWIAINPRKEGGLNKLDKKTGKFTSYLHKDNDEHSLTENRIRAIFEDSQGNFWVGSAGDGLHKMDRKTGSFERLPYNPAYPNRPSRPPVQGNYNGVDDHISFITEDSKGRIWIVTWGGGINVYDPATKTLSHYGSDKNSKEKLQNNNSWVAYKTSDDIIWISATGGLLYKINPYRVNVPYTYIGTSTIDFAEDSAQTMWLGTRKGLVHQNSLGVLKSFLINNDSSLKSNDINFIEKDDHNRLWLATNHGLRYVDPSTNQVSVYQAEYGNNKSPVPDTISVIRKSRDGQLWLGTYSRGLGLLDVKTGSFIKYEHIPADSNSISNNCIFSITPYREDNLWVATYSGLNRLNKQNGRFKKYLNNQFINWVMEDSEGVIWAGTLNGLFRYNPNADVFLSFTDQSGVIKNNTAIFGIAEDHQQCLWLNTWKGIVRLNKERNEAVVFGKNQGVNPIIFTNIGFTRQNGDVLFGDSAGYYSYNSKQLQLDTSTPRVIISSFLLNDAAVEPASNSVLTSPLEQTEEIRLKHNQNTFSLGFSSIDYVSSHEDTRLLYMLQNYDNNWRLSNENREAYYFNLPPGKYVFKVKAFGANGRSAEKQIGVFITPPWWTTGWAYSFYGLCLIAGIFFTDRIRRKKVIEKEQAKTRERELAQAKEIEKAYKQLEAAHENLKATQGQLVQSEKMASLGELTAGIAHEIQNPLNFMNNFSEVNTELIEEMKEELNAGNNKEAATIADNIAENEKKINIHGKRADAIVKGMLLHSRTNTGQKEPADINALADEYLRLSYHGLRARDKSFNASMKTDFDQTIGDIPIISQDIGRVLLNLYNNAFYAVSEKKKVLSNGYEPTVSVYTKKIDGKVEIKVKDNGNGIPQKVREKIFQPFFTTKPTGQGTGLGLSMSYDIVKAHGGEIKVDTKEGEGTEFNIMLPIV